MTIRLGSPDFLRTFRLAGRWLPAGRLGDVFGVQDHAMNAPCIPDVALRIGVQDQQIGALAGFDSAESDARPMARAPPSVAASRIARGASPASAMRSISRCSAGPCKVPMLMHTRYTLPSQEVKREMVPLAARHVEFS